MRSAGVSLNRIAWYYLLLFFSVVLAGENNKQYKYDGTSTMEEPILRKSQAEKERYTRKVFKKGLNAWLRNKQNNPNMACYCQDCLIVPLINEEPKEMGGGVNLTEHEIATHRSGVAD